MGVAGKSIWSMGGASGRGPSGNEVHMSPPCSRKSTCQPNQLRLTFVDTLGKPKVARAAQSGQALPRHDTASVGCHKRMKGARWARQGRARRPPRRRPPPPRTPSATASAAGSRSCPSPRRAPRTAPPAQRTPAAAAHRLAAQRCPASTGPPPPPATCSKRTIIGCVVIRRRESRSLGCPPSAGAAPAKMGGDMAS